MAASTCLTTWTLAVALATGADSEATKQDRAKMQGTWRAVGGVRDGDSIPLRELSKLTRRVNDNEYEIAFDNEEGVQSFKGSITLDAEKKPKTIDVARLDGPAKGRPILGIYEFDGKDLKLCFAPLEKPRPTDFSAKEGTSHSLTIWRPASEPAPEEPKKDSVLEPAGLDVIRRASELIQKSKSLHCEGTFTTAITAAGQQKHRVAAVYDVARENRLAVRMNDLDNPGRALEVRCDGKKLITHAEGLKQFIEADAPMDWQELRDALMQFGHVNTGALFQNALHENPAEMLMDGVVDCRSIGIEKVGDIPAHHVRCEQADMTWEMWVASEGKPLVLRFKSKRVGALISHMTDEIYNDWKIDNQADEKTFSTVLPETSRKVEQFGPQG